MTNITRSLPRSITLLIVGLSLSITLIYSVILLGYSWLVEDNIFNRLVQSEANYIQQQYLRTAEVMAPRPAFMSLHSNWQDVPDAIKRQYDIKPSQVEFSLDDGRTLHFKHFVLDETEFVLLADVAGLEVGRDYLPNVIMWLVGLASLLAITVSIISFFIAKKLTQPIKTLADNVAQLSVSSSAQVFAEDYPNNELRTLADKIGQSFCQLQSALQREVNFTRDVSHEIRTPISVIKNIMSHNQHNKQINAKEYEQISRANFELEKVTDTLLALARNESSEVNSVNMTELIENTLLQHFELNNSSRGQALEINLKLEENVFQPINQHLIQILLNNVLSNIVHYATEPEVSIILTQTNLIVSNKTSVCVPEHPQRQGVKGIASTGIGQGLNLIERISDLSHWTLKAEHFQGTFKLEFRFQKNATRQT